ncbi:MAG TPA: ribosome-associated translation inhibitor RaiA [Polyangiaceae bacterium]|nr:ribosome-associated translation inhibitor RaiA [Polyangiaceae bacterium]
MHLYITARHFDLTPSIREYVEKRLVNAIEGHATAHDLVRMEVQLTELDGHAVRFRCHILLQLPNNHDINITEETLDLYEAVDRAEKRLIRKLTDERQRYISAQRHGKQQEVAPSIEPEEVPEASTTESAG